MTLPIRVHLDREPIEAGDVLDGYLELLDDPRLAKVTSIGLECRVRLHGSGSEEHVVHSREVFHPPFVSGSELRFSLATSPDGPITWTGRHVKICWELFVAVDIPWAIDPKHTRIFEVVPRGTLSRSRLTG